MRKREHGMRRGLSGGRPLLAVVVVALGLALAPAALLAQVAPPALSTIPLPEIADIGNYIRDEQAAVRLGKALFWDMQVGSDGVQACASCHFHAGADSRPRNSFHPGPDGEFQTPGANAEATGALYPFHRKADIDERDSAVLSDTDDVRGSQGILKATFQGVRLNDTLRDRGALGTDAVFSVAGKNVRQATGRDAPTVINAAFNYSNFWDGRASNVFNGVDPFGELSPNRTLYVVQDGVLVETSVALTNSSLASQAVGPPNSDVEMAYAGRSFRDIGRKLLSLRPLAKQIVHPQDSVLGPESAYPERGLKSHIRYAAMVREAFQPEYWSSTAKIDGYSQMELNFSLFWGLAVQAYERTLISDDSRYDKVQRGEAVFTDQEAEGLDRFLGAGNCTHCHGGPEFTVHTVSSIAAARADGRIVGEAPVEQATMDSGRVASIDFGFFNVAVRPTAEDLIRGGTDPFGNPLSFTLRSGVDPADAAVDGACKAPSLRNIELTGPYFRNGGMATLLQVVDFYARGGDFQALDSNDMHSEVNPMGGVRGDQERKEAIVAFLLTLTDERVRNESAPFDHPQLFLPNGSPETDGQLDCSDVQIATGGCDRFLELPAVGLAGRSAEQLEPLRPYLNLDPFSRSGQILPNPPANPEVDGPLPVLFPERWATGIAYPLLAE